MIPTKAKAPKTGQALGDFQNQKQLVGARSVSQLTPSAQSLITAVDCLIARALALVWLDLDCSAEIELAQLLADAAERRLVV